MLQKFFQVFFPKIILHKVVNNGGMVGQELSSATSFGFGESIKALTYKKLEQKR
jgi:hypothetical protein